MKIGDTIIAPSKTQRNNYCDWFRANDRQASSSTNGDGTYTITRIR